MRIILFIFSLFNVNIFRLLYKSMPKELYYDILNCQNILQNKQWHPEIDVYSHLVTVTKRLYHKYYDINLILCGIFHDLGKIDTFNFDAKKNTYTAHGHEYKSLLYIDKYSKWITYIGGDINLIKFVVKNHMRFKHIDDMAMNEQILLIKSRYFKYLVRFNSADYGGFDLSCKEEKDLGVIIDRIKVYNKTKKINKKISSKFNGHIIMQLYPKLKGENLGSAINDFKKTFNDFNNYVLKSTSKKIINDFSNFIQSHDKYKQFLN